MGGVGAEVELLWLHRTVLDWYAVHARSLPWREPDCSPWGIFVSEVMAQQTPVARVEAPWREWMARWPTPNALASASPGDVVRAWGRLGYPRRALRLREAAAAMVERHDGEVPRTEAELLDLPGVGAYTAAAVAAFAYAVRTVVVDTNVRRVLARVIEGRAQASPSLTAAESRLAATVVPTDAETSAVWNVAVMELGALICQARSPQCGECPLSARCAWLLAGIRRTAAARTALRRDRSQGARRPAPTPARVRATPAAGGPGGRRSRPLEDRSTARCADQRWSGRAAGEGSISTPGLT